MEENIRSCSKKQVNFKYPHNIVDFNMVLEFFQRKTEDSYCNDSILMAENYIFNRLIVMDNVLGLADKSDNLANFFTVSRKVNFTCVYVFYTNYPTRSNWQVILSQTKIFNIFPGFLHTSSVIKILSSYSNRYTYEYIPHRDLWLDRLYFEIPNSSKKQCLTIDMRHVNHLELAKRRMEAKNDKEQVCYCNYNKRTGLLITF